MIRSAFAALLAAAFACLVHDTVRERCRDALLPNPDAAAVGLVAGATALIWLLIMLCRDPVEAEPAYTVQHHVSGWQPRPKPPTAGSAVQPPRDAAGRFVAVKPGQIVYLNADGSPAKL